MTVCVPFLDFYIYLSYLLGAVFGLLLVNCVALRCIAYVCCGVCMCPHVPCIHARKGGGHPTTQQQGGQKEGKENSRNCPTCIPPIHWT